MRNLSYYLFNLAVLSGPLYILINNREVRMKRAGLIAVTLGVTVPFVLWDIWAASAGHWGFNEGYVRGPYIAGIPLEEILFFITVPFAMLFVWEVIGLRIKEKVVSKWWLYSSIAISSILSVYLLGMYWDRGYTRSVALVLLLVMFLLWRSQFLRSRKFWLFSGIHLGCFLVMNSLLTALPIITYGEGSYIGYRIGTIPIEDFIFSFCMIGISLYLYNQHHGRKK